MAEHVRAWTGPPPRSWQWDIVVLALLLEQVGLPALFLQDPDLAEGLFAEAGIPAHAARQFPRLARRAPGLQGRPGLSWDARRRAGHGPG